MSSSEQKRPKGDGGIGSSVRRAARAMVVLVPVLVAAVVLWTAVDVVRVAGLDTEDLEASFEEQLAVRDSVPLPEFGGARATAGAHRVWALGGSSLVFPAGQTFVEQFSKLPGREPVLNLGLSGVESRALVEQFEKHLAAADQPPEVLIVYAGHNDYNVLYHTSFVREFDLFEPLFYVLAPFTHPGLKHGMAVYLRTRVPPILERLQEMGLADFTQLDLSGIDSRIAQRFKANLERIIARCRERRIRVVLVPALGNLRARPYGALATTSAAYDWGMALVPFGHGLELLRVAQQSEFLTYDIRAKAGIRQAMESFGAPDVRVADLDGWLEARGLRLDGRLFSDYFHFTEWGHAQVASFLQELVP